MSKPIVFLLLNAIGLITILVWVINQLKDLSTLPFKDFITWKRFKYPTILLIIIGIPVVVLNYTPYSIYYHVDDFTQQSITIYCWIISFLISMVWLIYILKLDIFEKEKWFHVALTFVLSFFATYGCDYLYPLFHSYGLGLNGDFINDAFYCVFGIGLIEETVKFLPFLFILIFTKAINEPYDYLLYASISALGFAFSENVLYLSNYGIQILSARAFFAAVAHMTFCSTVAYGLLLNKYRFKNYPSILVFIVFFFLAMLAHGFYDFWLINIKASEYNGLTTLFFLISIHLWVTMKNNAINISTHYEESIELNNDELKHHLVISLTSLFMFSYLYVALFFNLKEANDFFIESSLVYGYVIFYLIVSFSKYKVVKGVFKPLDLPFHFLIPRLKKEKE
jgi:RsiW-degrading membrane proteinase PrsW (M82 family)